MKSELWWPYIADYDGFPGSTVVNLALKTVAPLLGYSTLLVTGVGYQSSAQSSGLPDGAELDVLNGLSAKRLRTIEEHSKAVLVGRFTHRNERLDYIYVPEPAGLEAALRSFYRMECPTRQHYINLKPDPQWQAFLEFLYPNAETIRFYRAELVKLGAL